MTRIHRRIIYWVFFLLFLSAAPIILLGTAGYRVDLRRGRIYRTGLLLLAGASRDAEVSINGAHTSGVWREKTWQFPHLPAGRIRVRVQKEGFYPWEKDYWIIGGYTTTSSPVVLFPREAPLLVARGAFTLTPRRNLEDPITVSLPTREGGWTSFRLENRTLTPIPEKAATRTPAPQDTRTRPTLEESARGVRVLLGTDRGTDAQTLATLPRGAWRFLPSAEGFLTLLEDRNHQLAVIDLASGTTATHAPVMAAAWSTNGTLAYLERGMLQLRTPRTNATETTKLTVPAHSVLPVATLPIVLLLDRTSVRALERGSDNPFEQKLLALRVIREVAVSPTEDTLVLLGSDEKGPGIFIYDLPVTSY